MTVANLLRRPSACAPIVMSLAALTTVLVHVGRFGVTRETDEGSAAHLWQLLMSAQLLVIPYFIAAWLPRARHEALIVLTLQVCAALLAAAPVFLLGL